MEIIDTKLLKILACPKCYSSLEILDDQLVCLKKDCQGKFNVRANIPIFLSMLEDSTFKKAQIEFFDKWSDEDKGKKELGKTSFDRFFSPVVGRKKINYAEEEMRQAVMKLPKNSLVLELGCGAGEHTVFLARLRDDIHLMAIDLSLKSVIETRKRIKSDKRIKSRVSFLVGDAENLPFKKGVFSGIMVVMFFHHAASIEKTLREIYRTLRPKGIGLIVDLVGDNFLAILPRKIFPYFPLWLKNKFKKDYLLESGESPEVLLHKRRELKEGIKQAKLMVIDERSYDLFVFTLGYVGIVFPWVKYFFPERILNLLYNLEKKLLQIKFFQKSTGAAVLWVSH